MAEQLGLLDQPGKDTFEAYLDDISIRESRRARRLILQIVPPQRLELVVPRGTRPGDVQAFVSAHQDWIDRARAEIEQRHVGDRDVRPVRIALPAIDRVLDVRYRSNSGQRPGYRLNGSRLDVLASDDSFRNVGVCLRDCLVTLGRVHLKPWLMLEAQRVGDLPRQIQIRLQRTRWGSCSSRRTISLNASLLLLEPDLVRYLMIHELSHIRHLNHSPAYWAHVARFEPRFRQLDSELANAWTRIPYWVFAA